MRSHSRNSLNRRRLQRRGYALVVVLLFNVLFSMLLGITWRRMNSVIRVASTHDQQTQDDQGSLCVLADALRLLETGLPPSNPYHSGDIVVETSGTERFYTVTFTRDDSLPPAERLYWSVSVTETNLRPLDVLPDYFSPTANP